MKIFFSFHQKSFIYIHYNHSYHKNYFNYQFTTETAYQLLIVQETGKTSIS